MRKSKITKLLFAIVLGFAICWAPFVIIDRVSVFKGDYALPRQVYVMYIFFVSSSSAINPIIYGVMNRQFRVAFTKSLGLNCLLSRNPTRLRTISIMTRNRNFIAEEENAEVVGKKLESTATTSSETTQGRSVGSVKVRGNFPLRKWSVPFVTVNTISNNSVLSFS